MGKEDTMNGKCGECGISFLEDHNSEIETYKFIFNLCPECMSKVESELYSRFTRKHDAYHATGDGGSE